MYNVYLKTTKEMGRGIYAARDILENEVIMECEVLVLNESDTIKVNETDLKYYTFKYTDSRDCLVLGHGEIFNHSDMPNVSYKLVPFQDRLVMQFKALKTIPKDSQLFIDYAADTQVKTSTYIENESLLK
jgi:SET domain-containing protein